VMKEVDEKTKKVIDRKGMWGSMSSKAKQRARELRKEWGLPQI